MENFTIIGNNIGEAVGLGPASADFSHLDVAQIKVRTRGSKVSFEPITVTDGIRKYRVAIYPVVLGEVIKLGVDESKRLILGCCQMKRGRGSMKTKSALRKARYQEVHRCSSWTLLLNRNR